MSFGTADKIVPVGRAAHAGLKQGQEEKNG